MIQIVFYRKKCIGCNACVEIAPGNWKISRKDGKSVLVGGQKKKEYFLLDLPDEELSRQQKAARACIPKVIRVKKIS